MRLYLKSTSFFEILILMFLDIYAEGFLDHMYLHTFVWCVCMCVVVGTEPRTFAPSYIQPFIKFLKF